MKVKGNICPPNSKMSSVSKILLTLGRLMVMCSSLEACLVKTLPQPEHMNLSSIFKRQKGMNKKRDSPKKKKKEPREALNPREFLSETGK